MKKTKNDLISSWVDKGNRDLITAKNLFKESGFKDIICFHAQQACEKLLKAYLIHFNKEYPKTHDLENLIEILLDFDPEIKDWKENAAILSSYAVGIRYPDFDIPTQEDTLKAVNFSEKIFNYISQKLKEK